MVYVVFTKYHATSSLSQSLPCILHTLQVAHSFVRLTVIDVRTRRMSTMHFVDLAGSQSLDRRMSKSFKSISAENAKARRAINKHLLAFSRVVSELAQLHDGGKSENVSSTKLISARDSRLTQILGPIIANNSRTVFISTVSSLKDHYNDTVSTLRTATRALQISCPCVPTILPAHPDGDSAQPISETAGFLPLENVLSARMLKEICEVEMATTSGYSDADVHAGQGGLLVQVSAENSEGAVTLSRRSPAKEQSVSDRSKRTGSNESVESSSGSQLEGQIDQLRQYMTQHFPDEALLPSGTLPKRTIDDVGGDSLTQHSPTEKLNSPSKRAPSAAEVKHEIADRQGSMAAEYQRRFAQLYSELAETASRSPSTSAKLSLTTESLAEHCMVTAEPSAEEVEPSAEEACDTSPLEQHQINHDALLSALNHERSQNAKLSAKIDRLEQDAVERVTEHELAIETMRIQVIDLQGKYRKATSKVRPFLMVSTCVHAPTLCLRTIRQLSAMSSIYTRKKLMLYTPK